jgi:ABC-type antimicrobial peptide transport system permease subunit
MQSKFFQNTLGNTWINMRLNPNLSPHEAIDRVEKVFQSVIPSVPLEFKFIDQEYDMKFSSEERIGKLASVFALLAIFISCLGLFGLASFVAQQRTKEIGLRKVMGATIFNLWKMLSKDFIVLVAISIFISIPIAYYGLSNWLNGFQYHTVLAWWIFTSAGLGAIFITLFTVSYQSIKAALMNPVESLRNE